MQNLNKWEKNCALIEVGYRRQTTKQKRTSCQTEQKLLQSFNALNPFNWHRKLTLVSLLCVSVCMLWRRARQKSVTHLFVGSLTMWSPVCNLYPIQLSVRCVLVWVAGWTVVIKTAAKTQVLHISPPLMRWALCSPTEWTEWAALIKSKCK